MQLPIKSGVADQVIASNPYIKGLTSEAWLPGVADALKPGGQLIINATSRNETAILPSINVLENLGLRVVREPRPLLPQFENSIFHTTKGIVIPSWKVQSTILEKL